MVSCGELPVEQGRLRSGACEDEGRCVCVRHAARQRAGGRCVVAMQEEGSKWTGLESICQCLPAAVWTWSCAFSFIPSLVEGCVWILYRGSRYCWGLMPVAPLCAASFGMGYFRARRILWLLSFAGGFLFPRNERAASGLGGSWGMMLGSLCFRLPSWLQLSPVKGITSPPGLLPDGAPVLERGSSCCVPKEWKVGGLYWEFVGELGVETSCSGLCKALSVPLSSCLHRVERVPAFMPVSTQEEQSSPRRGVLLLGRVTFAWCVCSWCWSLGRFL